MCLTLGNNLISLHLLDVVTRLSSPLSGRVETRNIHRDRWFVKDRYRSHHTDCGKLLCAVPLAALACTTRVNARAHVPTGTHERARSASGAGVIHNPVENDSHTPHGGFHGSTLIRYAFRHFCYFFIVLFNQFLCFLSRDTFLCFSLELY